MNVVIPFVVAVLSGAVMTAQARAAEENMYIGVAAALSKVKLDAGKVETWLGPAWENADTTVDDSGEGLKIYAGWQPYRYLAFELGYSDLGKVNTYSRVGTASSLDTMVVEWDAYSIDLSAIGTWRIGEVFSLYARGGAAVWDMKRSRKTGGTGGFHSETDSDSGVSPLAGAGVAFRFTGKGTLRIEYQRYFKMADSLFKTGDGLQFGDSDIDVVSIGAHYHF